MKILDIPHQVTRSERLAGLASSARSAGRRACANRGTAVTDDRADNLSHVSAAGGRSRRPKGPPGWPPPRTMSNPRLNQSGASAASSVTKSHCTLAQFGQDQVGRPRATAVPDAGATDWSSPMRVADHAQLTCPTSPGEKHHRPRRQAAQPGPRDLQRLPGMGMCHARAGSATSRPSTQPAMACRRRPEGVRPGHQVVDGWKACAGASGNRPASADLLL